ncbi:phosphoribosylglycinamide formyltransferase [Haloferula sp. BvORR071]|uniref:phosphoribosylglycinamide formyltransferase n=1 Tax=Haloferula sp. BvORR071 TaxID=1396141 RepID=UPI000695E653|nr:phosphoribosylglycinamide formyltransferase [Haloferula sp. BvORR071]
MGLHKHWNLNMNLGFFASHGGSNMQAIIDATKAGKLKARPALLISNNRNSQATARAEQEGMPFQVMNSVTHADSDALDQAMLDALREHQIDLIILAGYMKKIGPKVLAAYEGRILNIHPALLPKFGGQGMFGQHVHRAVLEAGETVTGVTIHLVNDHYDEGRILAQSEVPVLPGDSVESLAARVLVREHQFFVETLAKIAEGELQL